MITPTRTVRICSMPWLQVSSLPIINSRCSSDFLLVKTPCLHFGMDGTSGDASVSVIPNCLCFEGTKPDLKNKFAFLIGILIQILLSLTSLYEITDCRSKLQSLEFPQYSCSRCFSSLAHVKFTIFWIPSTKLPLPFFSQKITVT